MQINTLIKKMRYKCGLNGVLKDVVDDQDLYDIIDLFTRETFSRYFKHVFVIENMQFNELNRSRRSKDIYLFPEKLIDVLQKNEISISGIKEIEPMDERDKMFIGKEMAMLPGYNNAVGNQSGVFLGAAYNKMRRDIYESPLEAEFLSPYSIQIKKEYYDISHNSYRLELFSDHPKNLSTIKDSYAETFEELAELDIKEKLWSNVIGYLNRLSLGTSEVNLNKEEWQSAGERRKQLIEEFDESYISDYPSIFVV
ncbi:MAG: hypothetical protein ACOCQD_01430 [archaeon]